MAFTLFLQFLFAASALGQISRPAAQCPGYRATNIVQGDSYLAADLVLIGNCSSHSRDIENLRLLVEYQTGKANRSFAHPFD
jgi:alpha-glucosidase